MVIDLSEMAPCATTFNHPSRPLGRAKAHWRRRTRYPRVLGRFCRCRKPSAIAQAANACRLQPRCLASSCRSGVQTSRRCQGACLGQGVWVAGQPRKEDCHSNVLSWIHRSPFPRQRLKTSFRSSVSHVRKYLSLTGKRPSSRQQSCRRPKGLQYLLRQVLGG